ncbi:hypothetical protein [Mycolicibacterium thermoresistibile]
MTHRRPVLTAVALAAALLTAPVAVAQIAAEAPEPDAQCSLNLADALTRLPDGETTLLCVDHGGDNYRWEPYPSPYPLSDRWFSYGPDLQLRGQGLRNPEMMSGRWTGYPQDPDGQCSVEQVEVVRGGEVGPPQPVAGEPGQPVQVLVSPTMFSIGLSGHCLWQKDG